MSLSAASKMSPALDVAVIGCGEWSGALKADLGDGLKSPKRALPGGKALERLDNSIADHLERVIRA